MGKLWGAPRVQSFPMAEPGEALVTPLEQEGSQPPPADARGAYFTWTLQACVEGARSWWRGWPNWWLRETTGRGLVSPLPEQATQQMQRLDCPRAIAFIGIAAVYCLNLGSVVDGWFIFKDETLPPQCCLLQYWLLGYCIIGSILLCWFMVAGCLMPFGAAFVMIGKLLQVLGPQECRKQAPETWCLVDKAIFTGCVTVVGGTSIGLLFYFIENRLLDIQRRWGEEGPATDEVIDRILAGAPPEALPDYECSICLREDLCLLSEWRVLLCGHRFHKDCLREWLRHKRRCPLCRQDLHAVYLPA